MKLRAAPLADGADVVAWVNREFKPWAVVLLARIVVMQQKLVELEARIKELEP
jgi:hypothetical protein